MGLAKCAQLRVLFTHGIEILAELSSTGNELVKNKIKKEKKKSFIPTTKY